MKMNLYFGDYYDDGHGKYHQVIAEVPSEEHLKNTIKAVTNKYPNFFRTFCRSYEDQSIGPDVEKALLETNYPMERFIITNDDTDFEQFETLSQLFSSEYWQKRKCTVNTIEFVADAVIWVLNTFGGCIIPMDNPNYPSYQFGSGYGMFW